MIISFATFQALMRPIAEPSSLTFLSVDKRANHSAGASARPTTSIRAPSTIPAMRFFERQMTMPKARPIERAPANGSR